MPEPEFKTIYARVAEELGMDPSDACCFHLVTFVDDFPPGHPLREEITFLLNSGD